MAPDALLSAASSVPPGPWAVAVSGGADSIALLALLRQRPDLDLHVVHLNHQTRGEASAGDARFVRELAERWQLPVTVALREEVERDLAVLPRNLSARFRAARLALFRRVVTAHGLRGVLLAHHADDQAETVLHRLLRGSGLSGLAGMSGRATVGGLLILRPLLAERRAELRHYLREIPQPWREDDSNRSPKYLRNRLRWVLGANPELTGALLALSLSCQELREWLRQAAPLLPERFTGIELGALPEVLAGESARKWLRSRGAPAGELSPTVLRRLIDLTTDAASPPRQSFPGNLLVRRRGGVIWAE